MASCALYYPFIRVPETVWFTQSLLYWDNVGAMVPLDFALMPERLGPYMQGLVREGLVDQVIPGHHLGQAPNFGPAFLEFIDGKREIQQAKDDRPWFDIHSESLIKADVHMEKLQSLGADLCERGLARKKPTRDPASPWYEVEPSTADDFMAYLAAVLGQLAGPEVYYPITDSAPRLDSFIGQSHAEHRKPPIRKVLLEQILPAPTESLEPGQIASFKVDHSAELQRFRNEIEDKVSEISTIENDEDRSDRTKHVANSLKEHVAEIGARMNEEKGWPQVTFADFCAVIGSGLGGWKALADGDLFFGLGAAGVSLAPAVVNAFKGSGVDLSDKPMAYATFVNKELKANNG